MSARTARRRGSYLIERYTIAAIVPYLLLALLLLTLILFVQQASRFAELLLVARVPATLLIDVASSLLPTVLVFTLPMATLAGVVIGFSRMIGDSELIAIRAAGVSDLRVLTAALLVGAFMSALSLYVNVSLSPEAARALRRAGLEAALRKLDSPVEPRTFNTDIPGYVVYVRAGDNSEGRWEHVFISSKLADGTTRLVTARSGRIDFAGEQSELVLSDAVATTIPVPGSPEASQYVTERLSQLRITLETGRKTILEKLRADDRGIDELYLQELAAFASANPGPDGREAATLYHRRLTLAFSPLVFALLGTGLCLRLRRGGRGWGSLLSLVVLIVYYMLALFGEQLSRKGSLPPQVGGWIATVIAVIAGAALLFAQIRRGDIRHSISRVFARKRKETTVAATEYPTTSRSRLLSFPSLLDMSVLRGLAQSCVFAYFTLVAIFLIFTLFELWRFIIVSASTLRLVAEYLLFLMPLVTVQVLPASLLIALLATYALMARRSEAVAWWAGGQSVYRLMVPGIVFASLIGLCSWLVQERLLPKANLMQDSLRAQIRGGNAQVMTRQGRQWLASATSAPYRIYAYDYDEGSGALLEPVVYEFDSEGVHVQRLISGSSAEWRNDHELNVQKVETLTFENARVAETKADAIQLQLNDGPELFRTTLDKPSQLSATQLKAYIGTIKRSGRGSTTLSIALHRKYAEPFVALMMASFGIPLALSFGKRSAVAALSTAVAVGLAFWGASGIFQQLGEYGLLPPTVAAWSPLGIFTVVGCYLLTRVRT